MGSWDTLYYADYTVLLIDRPTYDECEGNSLTFWRLKLLQYV